MDDLALSGCMAMMFVVAMICTIIFKKIKLPAIVGYLATGIIISIVWHANDDPNVKLIVDLLSSLGLAMLMFSIGMELNFEKLRKNGVFSVMIVLVQIPIVIISGLIFGGMLGWDPLLSICMGAILSGSSTAVVIVVQKERKVLEPEAVDTLLLILVIEDVAQVVMLSVLTPMLNSGSSGDATGVLLLIAEIIVFMVLAVFVGIRFVPRILDWIGDKMSDEVLLISALAMCFLLAFVSECIHMSMAVGAFLMGVIVSQCRHHEHIEHSIEPMKDVFMAMFFISIGLMVNPNDLLNNIPLMIGIFLLFVISRTIAIYLGFLIGNKEPRLSFVSATSLVTMGEFAFIISSAAVTAGVMSSGVQAAVIGAALITMVAQPFITSTSGHVYDAVSSNLPSPVKRLNSRIFEERSRLYVKFGQLSNNTLKKLRKLVMVIYFSGFASFVVFFVFYNFTDEFVNFVYDNITQLSMEASGYIVRIVEFVIFLIPLSVMVSNIKTLIKNSTNAGNVSWDTTSQKEMYLKRTASINLWVPTIILDSLLLFFIPSHLDIVPHILTSLAGTMVFLLIWLVLYLRSAKKFKAKSS